MILLASRLMKNQTVCILCLFFEWSSCWSCLSNDSSSGMQMIRFSVEFRHLSPGGNSVAPWGNFHFFDHWKSKLSNFLGGGHFTALGGECPPPGPPPEFNAESLNSKHTYLHFVPCTLFYLCNLSILNIYRSHSFIFDGEYILVY